MHIHYKYEKKSNTYDYTFYTFFEYMLLWSIEHLINHLFQHQTFKMQIASS